MFSAARASGHGGSSSSSGYNDGGGGTEADMVILREELRSAILRLCLLDAQLPRLPEGTVRAYTPIPVKYSRCTIAACSSTVVVYTPVRTSS